MLINKMLVLLIVGATLVLSAKAQQQGSEPALSNDTPLLKIDLRKFGYEEYGPTQQRSRALQLNTLDFVDDNRVAWAWLTVDSPRESGPFRPDPAHLHVLLVDTRTGQQQGQKEWSTLSYPVKFWGLRNGKFLTCSGGTLRLISPSLELLREQELPANSPQPSDGCTYLGLWDISPNRRALLLVHRDGQAYDKKVLDTETFALETIDHTASAIADHWFTGTCGESLELCVSAIDPTHQPSRAISMNKEMSEKFNGAWRFNNIRFVNDDTVVITTPEELETTNTDGSELFHVKLPKDRSFDALTVATTGGRRFAVIENRQRGVSNERLDLYAFPANDRIVVFDISERRPVYALKVEGRSPWSPSKVPSNSMALSPDGSVLALVSDGVLTLHRVSVGNSR